MGGLGLLANAALTLGAAALFLLAADAVRMRRQRHGQGPGVIFVFHVLFGLVMLLAGLRLLVARASLADPAWMVTDRALFYAICVTVAAMIGPMMHLATHIITGNRHAARIASVAFFVLGLVALWGLMQSGLAGPDVSPWNSDWRIVSPLTIVVLIVAGVVPALATAAVIVHQARYLDGAQRTRALGIAATLYLYFLMLALGAIGIHGFYVLLERAVYLCAGWVAWRSQLAHKDLWTVTATPQEM